MTVWRTFRVRVHPGLILVFKTNAGDDDNSSDSDNPGFFSKVKTSIVDDQSLLSWADKGQWETGAAADVQVVREGDWFRIGFEPMFVDFTRPGTWFLLISLVEVRPVDIAIDHCGHRGKFDARKGCAHTTSTNCTLCDISLRIVRGAYVLGSMSVIVCMRRVLFGVAPPVAVRSRFLSRYSRAVRPLWQCNRGMGTANTNVNILSRITRTPRRALVVDCCDAPMVKCCTCHRCYLILQSFINVPPGTW